MEIHAGHLLRPFSSYCSTEGTPLIANHGTPPKPPAGGAQSGTTSPTPHDITTRHGATAPQPGTALDGSTRLSRHHYRPSKKTPPEPQNTTNAFSTGHTKQRAGWMDSLPTPPSLHASRLSQPLTGLPAQIPSKKKNASHLSRRSRKTHRTRERRSLSPESERTDKNKPVSAKRARTPS